MENNEQKYYEDLKLLKRIKLRREFNGLSGYGILWQIILILAYVTMAAGMILFFISMLSPNKRYWHFSGIIMMNVGMFVLFGMLQMMTAKEKNFIKALGSKKQVIIFFIALVVSVIGNTCVLVFIFTKSKEAWLQWASFLIPNLGALIFLIPRIKPKQDMDAAKKEEKKFFDWLEKEKNIVRKSIKQD